LVKVVKNFTPISILQMPLKGYQNTRNQLLKKPRIMDFQIINNKGIFEIHGNLTLENTNYAKDYFNTLLDTYYEIVICLHKVKKIDKSALNVLKFISNKAKKRSKTLFVLGEENKAIKSKMTKSGLNFIFKNEY